MPSPKEYQDTLLALLCAWCSIILDDGVNQGWNRVALWDDVDRQAEAFGCLLCDRTDTRNAHPVTDRLEVFLGQRLYEVGDGRRTGKGNKVNLPVLQKRLQEVPSSPRYHRPVDRHHLNGCAPLFEILRQQIPRDFGPWQQDLRTLQIIRLQRLDDPFGAELGRDQVGDYGISLQCIGGCRSDSTDPGGTKAS